MIESMACGTPVAAYPCQGPEDVIDEGITGCMRPNLKDAVDAAIKLDRASVCEGSNRWSWDKCWQIFKDNLIPSGLTKA
jgi:glycosyltransferase involved in cell wall biosynthesis